MKFKWFFSSIKFNVDKSPTEGAFKHVDFPPTTYRIRELAISHATVDFTPNEQWRILDNNWCRAANAVHDRK